MNPSSFGRNNLLIFSGGIYLMSAVQVVGVKILFAHLKALEMKMRKLVLDLSVAQIHPEEIKKVFLLQKAWIHWFVVNRIVWKTLFISKEGNILNKQWSTSTRYLVLSLKVKASFLSVPSWIIIYPGKTSQNLAYCYQSSILSVNKRTTSIICCVHVNSIRFCLIHMNAAIMIVKKDIATLHDMHHFHIQLHLDAREFKKWLVADHQRHFVRCLLFLLTWSSWACYLKKSGKSDKRICIESRPTTRKIASLLRVPKSASRAANSCEWSRQIKAGFKHVPDFSTNF